MIDNSNRWKGGRGYKKYCFDVREFAEFFGKAVQTVRNDIVKGKVDLGSLKSIFKYYKGEE